MRHGPLLTFGLAALLGGCASHPKTPASGGGDDLDVAMGDQAKEAPAVTYADVVPKKGDAKSMGVVVPKTAVTNWQAFFKAPPSVKERHLLEQRLAAWQDTESPQQLVAKGRDEEALGRYVAAEADFRKALRLKSEDLEAQLELAALYLRKKSLPEAFDFLAQVKEGLATSDDVGQTLVFKYRYTLAVAYIARGDRAKGHKVLSDLIGLDKTFAPAYATLAASYLAVGKDSVAEFVVRRGLDRAKDDAALLNLMGVVAQKQREHEVARSWYDKALAASPTYAPALVNRATLSTLSLEYGAAEEDLVQALACDPQSVDALVALGIVQKRQGNISGAKASFAKAVDLDPEHAYARFNLAVLLADDLKKPNEALRLFHEVLQTASPGSELKELAHNYINDLHKTGEPL